MKRSVFYSFALMAVAFVSCYEGFDLQQTYEAYDKDQYLTMEEAVVSLTTAKISVALDHPKYQSQIDVYYTDQPNVDICKKGQKQTFIVGERDSILANEAQVTLTDLMPDTDYRYTAVYSDASDKRIQLDEKSFHTSEFIMYSHINTRNYFEFTVYTSFDNLVNGAEPAYLIGKTRNLTIDNAEQNIAVAKEGSQYAGCYEVVDQLEPDTEYYLRPYIIYKDRVYYGDIESHRTPSIAVNFLYFKSQAISERLVRLNAYASLQNISYDSPTVLPQLEYGLVVDKQPGVTYSEATRHVVENVMSPVIEYEMTDLIPAQPYYAKAYVRWKDQVMLSDEISFSVSKGELSGPIDSLCINGQMVRFILVKAGTFMMGATEEQQAYARADEYPAHEVTISTDYYISEYEITNATITGVGDKMPARMSNADACDFAAYVSQITGIRSVKLPTEAEWEYAARGGHLYPKQTLFAGSDDADEVAWVIDDPMSQGNYGYEYPSVYRGGQKKPNALGIYDMCGNVAEWVRDAYQSQYYETSPAVDPCCTIDQWAMSGEMDRTTQIVVRGGGARSEWMDMSLLDYRVSARRFTDGGEPAFGFRLVIRNN